MEEAAPPDAGNGGTPTANYTKNTHARGAGTPRARARVRSGLGRPARGRRQLHRLLGPPRSAGHFQHKQSPAPTSSLRSRAARSDRAGAAAGGRAASSMRARKGSAHQEAREDDGDGADAVGMEVGNHAEVRARKPAKGGPLRHERSHRAAAAGAPGGVEHTLEWTPQGRLRRERYLRTS